MREWDNLENLYTAVNLKTMKQKIATKDQDWGSKG